jgi:hypothetical protein
MSDSFSAVGLWPRTNEGRPCFDQISHFVLLLLVQRRELDRSGAPCTGVDMGSGKFQIDFSKDESGYS